MWCDDAGVWWSFPDERAIYRRFALPPWCWPVETTRTQPLGVLWHALAATVRGQDAAE